MKQQTRLVALLLALVFCLSMLSGCQKKDDENKNNDDQQNQDEQKEIVLNTDYTDNGVVLREPAYEDDLLGTGAKGANGAASCASELASQMAVELMKKGGNAVDAAVFMIYAVGLLEPSASGIGGAGQLLIYLAEEDKYVVVEYMTQAGEKAIPGTLEVSRNGKISPQCIAIPGIVHGTLTALEKYGNLSPKEVLQPLVDSGDITIIGAEGDSLTLKSGSGDMTLSDCSFSSGSAVTGSGDIDADGLKSGGFDVKTGSGECTISGELKGTTSVRSSSGDASITTSLARSCYDLTTDLNSGDMDIDNSEGHDADDHDNHSKHHSGSRKYTMNVQLGSGNLELTFR